MRTVHGLQNFQLFCHFSKHFLTLERLSPAVRSARSTLLLLLLAGSQAVTAPDLPRFCSSAVGQGLAGAESCLPGESANPAVWDTTADRSVRFGYAIPFGLAELAEHHLDFTWQGLAHKWAAAIAHSGFSQFEETTLRVSYSRRLWHTLYGGLTAAYDHLAIIRYGETASCRLEGHLYWPLRRDWAIALVANRLAEHSMDNRRPTAGIVWRSGVRFNPHRVLTIYTDLYQETPYPAEVRMGLQWQCHTSLWLRLGWSAEPMRATGGLGIELDHLRLDYGCGLHADLGWSQQATIRFRF